MAFAKKITTNIYENNTHSPKATSLDIGSTGRVLVTGGLDKNVKLWALGDKECFMSLSGHTTNIDCVKFAYNDDYVFSADENGVIRNWDLNTQKERSIFYGHMKSVKALHFHPYGEYVISGSNDTSVRLWDSRTGSLVKKYRGHISNVNCVKFSPDGRWIASAGNEGAVIIWDIRSSRQLMEFTERNSPATCIQFHPSEFLLAAGRSDGVVDFYDLEKFKTISSLVDKKPLMNNIRHITFSETEQCLFVGTSNGVSMVGWEPEKLFDHVEGSWSNLGDMKEITNSLYCGALEDSKVVIHSINLNYIMPFYNPSNIPFHHNHTSRKSFDNRVGKLRLSVERKSHRDSEGNTNSNDGGTSSPNLSIEMIDEEELVENAFSSISIRGANNTASFSKQTQQPYNPESSYQLDQFINAPSTLATPPADSYNVDYFSSDLDYYPVRSSSNGFEPDREDFPVNSAQLPDYALKSKPNHPPKSSRDQNSARRQTNIIPVRPQAHGVSRKLTASVSSTELHRLDESTKLIKRKPVSRNASPNRNTVQSSSSNQNKYRKNDAFNNNNKIKSIPIQIYANKPVRSKTSIDMKQNLNNQNEIYQQQQYSQNNHVEMRSMGTPPQPKSLDYVSANEEHEIQLMMTCHDAIYQSLQNRISSLTFLKNSSQSADTLSLIKSAILLNDHSVLVDILGGILENGIPFSLDICVALLPEIFELLKSEYRFHNIRAYDTLRIVVSDFLPLIQDNCDPYVPAAAMGIDISREERKRKCLHCREWLLRIRALPENKQLGVQLQSLISDL